MATYYVKAAGGTGSGADDANAWSFAKLNATALSAGDTVLFKRGDTFDGELITDAGTSGNPVTYGVYGTGDKPKLTVLTELTSWTLHAGNIYYATLDVSMLNIVTLDGVIKGMGRWPKSGYLAYTGHTNNTAITGATISALPFDADGAEVVIRKYRWILDRATVASHSGSSITYTTGNGYGNSGVYNPIDGNGYFIQNHLSCVTQEGDWWYDNTNNRVYMHFGSGTPSGRTVKVGGADRNFATSSKSYITFNDLEFEGGNIYGGYITSCTGITINDCTFSKQGGVALYGFNSITFTVDGVEITDALNAGVWVELGGSGVTVTNCTVENIGIAGMGRSGDSSYNGIAITGGNSTVTDNSLYNIGYNGIAIDGNDALIEHNFVNTFCNIKDDGGGIYVGISSTVVNNTRLVNENIVINGVGAEAGAEGNTDGTGKAAGIYLDGDINSSNVTNNVVAHTDFNGIFINNNSDNVITGNLTYDCGVGFWISQVTAAGMVRDNTVAGNKFIAKSADQECMHILTVYNDDISLFGTFNNNVYARPIDSLDVIFTHNFGAGQSIVGHSVAEWKSGFSQDANSDPYTYTVDSTSNIRFFYSVAGHVYTLSGVWKDMDDTVYTSLTLGAYSGKVLVTEDYALCTIDGNLISYNGKILFKVTE